MIKNLNDFLSLFVLAVLCIFSIRILVWTNVKKDDEQNDISRWQIFKEYIDNTEE